MKKNNRLEGFCIWDILAYDGKILLGSTIEERIDLINSLYPSVSAKSINKINYLYTTDVPDIYKVANYTDDFKNIFDNITKVDVVEGLVLKRKNGKLEMMTREQNNVGWSIKSRKPTLNYKF
jgi:ATP-dependent DNA ligase